MDKYYNRIIYDPKFFIESLVSIVDKDRRTVPFIFNAPQQRYYKERSYYDIILKARQLGFSTLIMALFLHDTMFMPNTISTIVAQTNKDAVDLFERVKFMFYSIPEVFRPHIDRDNRGELFFDKINSMFFVGSAESENFGRSKVINNLHCSEVSAPSWKESFFIGVLESVPEGGRVVLESTARGEGGPFHRYYTEAKEGINEYKTHYYRWFEMAPYAMELLPSEVLSLTDHERKISVAYNLSLEQIKWRRRKVARMGRMFIQEYPEESDEDAFIKTGSPVFDVDLLRDRDRELPEQTSNEIWLGGDLFIYKIVGEGARYIVGVDTSEGDVNSDFGAAMVVRTFPPPVEQVALLHGRWSPDNLSEKVYKIAKAYNEALIIVERNNHGHAVLLNLNNGIVRYGQVKYPPYPFIFYGPDGKLGWLTGLNKANMVAEVDRAIRNGTLVINSKRFISEARKFSFLKGNKLGAQTGSHDDTVMAQALALMGVMMGRFDFSME